MSAGRLPTRQRYTEEEERTSPQQANWSVAAGSSENEIASWNRYQVGAFRCVHTLCN